MLKTRPALRRRYLAPVAVFAAFAMAIGGCSSSGSDDGSSSPTVAAPTTGGGASTGSSDEGLARAVAATAKNKIPPTSITQSTPLKEKPPSGKTFVFLRCSDVNQCADESDGYKAAADILGWNFKTLSYLSSDPATLVSALKQALDFNPVAVSFSGLPRAVWDSVVPDYRKAGVKIVTMYLGPTDYDDVVIGQVGGTKDVQEYGNIIGNWVVADSGGKANILLQEVNDFPILKDYVIGFKKAISDNCTDCKITELNNTIAQLGGQIVPSVIAALQKDPDINYVSSVNGPFLSGLPAALQAAGLTDVKICGESGDVSNLTDVKAGKQGAFTGLALHQASFSAMDMVLRSMQGMDFDPEGNGGSPKQLLTKDADFEVTNSYDVPADYADQFKKLWLEN